MTGQTFGFVYPGAFWQKVDPKTFGWSTKKLDDARQYLRTLAPGSVIVVDRGRIVVEWGDPARRVKLSSVRKSLLSALYGIYVHQERLDLNKTLEQLGVDDDPPLTPSEKQATLRMLLQSRSGVYHPYVGGAPSDRAAMPARGSHVVGSFWYYNNWDFNVLGTVFEEQLNTRIAVEFRNRIAIPIQMQDFRLEDMYYFRGTSKKAAIEDSIHPAYHFRMTARDMARFGYLYLRQGKWSDVQIVPNEWVAESTTSYSEVGNGGGYGYLWWVNGWPGVSVKSYSARGALGKYIIVIPERDLVVVYQNHTEFPDDAAAMADSDVTKLPSVSGSQMGKLLALILDAEQFLPTQPGLR